MYAVLVGLVYFTQLTTIRLSKLNEQALAILDYKNLGSLFFNYDLFGYAFMAISTFFIALTIETNNKKDKWLKALLLIHGVFAVSCIIMPILGVFSTIFLCKKNTVKGKPLSEFFRTFTFLIM